MKIGLDLDGTITEIPKLFSVLSNALVATGNEVHVITYRQDNKQIVAEELSQYGVAFTDIHLPKPDDDFRVWKGKLVRQLDIEIMFEDSPEVLSNMPKNVKRIWICDPEMFDLNAAISGMRANMRMGTIT